MLDRKTLATWLERPQVSNAVMGVILVNALVLGLETSPTIDARVGDVLQAQKTSVPEKK